MSKEQGFSDSDIIQAIKLGDDNRAIAWLYKKVLPKVRHFVLSNSGDADEANDIFQDAVIIFYKQVKLEKFNPQFEIAGFIYSVSRNLYINYVKRKNRQTELSDAHHETASDDNLLEGMITREREKNVNDLLGMLGERCRELLVYSVFQKLSMKEIAEKMGFSNEHSAKTRNYKCKQNLIGLIENNPSLAALLKK
ncbi:MAG: sigma-70 family RNA polymerase sigma factor [Bacteroidota bacterium]